MVPFSILILLGALIVGVIEGWGWVESIYFAVVSMTTVGFGDYFPDKLASTWFCIIWLPFSVGFLSLYLGSVAHLYIAVSARNVDRIEKKMRYNLSQAREAEERERAEVLSRGTSPGFDLNLDEGGNDDTLDKMTHLQTLQHQKNKTNRFSSLKSPQSISKVDSEAVLSPESSIDERRDNILRNSGFQRMENDNGDFEVGETMKTMKDVIVAVKLNMITPRRSQTETHGSTSAKPSSPVVLEVNDLLSVKSTRHYNTSRGMEKKPPFALRVLLQERFCEIIGHEIAGYQTGAHIKNNTLSVTIDSLKYTADKWLIPRRARKSFRAVSFEVLYFVGERNLIVRGANAVFDLRPHEVQGMFAPLLAAFGDADTMEAWLMRTHAMAENEFKRSEDSILEARQIKFDSVVDRRTDKITMNMTASPNMRRNVIGNAVTNQP